MTWKLISGWVDARTANKVEIYSSKKKAEKRLAELVDESELPSDYGGKATSTLELLESHNLRKENENLSRQVTKLIPLRSSSQFSIKLDENETIHSSAFTRSLNGAQFYMTTSNKKKDNRGVTVKHNGIGRDEEAPTRIDFERKFSGPCVVKIRVEKTGKSLAAKNFLFVGKIFDANKIIQPEKIRSSPNEKCRDSPTKVKNEQMNKDNGKSQVERPVDKQRLFIEINHSTDSQFQNSYKTPQTPIQKNEVKKIDAEIFEIAKNYSNTYKIVDEKDHATGSFWSCGWNSCW